MAYTIYEIDTYIIHQLDEDYPHMTATIYCYKIHDLKGILQFWKDGESIPASKKTSTGILYIRLNEHKFRDIVETLRLEKPLYLYFEDDYSRGYLSTSREPMGEEEAT